MNDPQTTPVPKLGAPHSWQTIYPEKMSSAKAEPTNKTSATFHQKSARFIEK